MLKNGLAQEIYNVLNRYRRNHQNLQYDGSLIIEKIQEIISHQLPLKLVLPAFHGKSNNPDFVVSNLPDYGEYLCIKLLTELYEKLSHLYNNVEILILHEGHFHADVQLFGDDNDVEAYIKQFRQLISFSPFMKSYCINELIPDGLSFEEKRSHFLQTYCPTVEETEILITEGGRLAELYLAYKKLYSEKIIDSNKTGLSNKELRVFAKNKSILQLRKYIGFAKLIKEVFVNDKFIKLSWVYKDTSVKDQISLQVLGNNTCRLGTPGFFSVVKHPDGEVDFITMKQAVQSGLSLKNFNKLPYYTNCIAPPFKVKSSYNGI